MTVHPGLWLKPKIDKHFGDTSRFADAINYSHSGLSKVLNGQRAMTYQLALAIEGKLSKVSASALMKRQVDYDFEQIRAGTMPGLLEVPDA